MKDPVIFTCNEDTPGDPCFGLVNQVTFIYSSMPTIRFYIINGMFCISMHFK